MDTVGRVNNNRKRGNLPHLLDAVWQSAKYLVRWPFIYMLFKCLTVISERRQYEGLVLWARNDLDDCDNFFEVTIQALGVLKRMDRRRFKRVKNQLSTIAYIQTGLNQYISHLSLFAVDSFPPGNHVYFASVIVHEATHGFLHSKGFGPSKATQEQHERICTKEQVRFLQRVVLQSDDYSVEKKKDCLAELDIWFREQMASRWWESHKINTSRMERLTKIFSK
jgi:hypothetical protein